MSTKKAKQMFGLLNENLYCGPSDIKTTTYYKELAKTLLCTLTHTAVAKPMMLLLTLTALGI